MAVAAAKAAGDDVRPAHAVGPSQQAPLLRWLEARHLRGQASNGQLTMQIQAGLWLAS